MFTKVAICLQLGIYKLWNWEKYSVNTVMLSVQDTLGQQKIISLSRSNIRGAGSNIDLEWFHCKLNHPLLHDCTCRSTYFVSSFVKEPSSPTRRS